MTQLVTHTGGYMGLVHLGFHMIDGEYDINDDDDICGTYEHRYKAICSRIANELPDLSGKEEVLRSLWYWAHFTVGVGYLTRVLTRGRPTPPEWVSKG